MSQNETRTDVKREAQRLEQKTDLDYEEAVIAAGSDSDLDDGEIGRIIGYDGFSVQETRAKLRERYFEIGEELDRLEKTRDALDGL